MATGKVYEMLDANFRLGGRFQWDIADLKGRFFMSDSVTLKSRNFSFSGFNYYMSVRKGISVDAFIVSLSQCNDSPPQSLIVRIGLQFGERSEKVRTRMHTKNKDFRLGDWMDYFPKCTFDGSKRWDSLGRLTILCELRKLSEETLLVLQGKIPSEEVEDSDEEETGSEYTSEENEDSDEEEADSKYKTLIKLQKDLNNLFKSGEDCDVSLKVQNKEFPAHRNILRARSPVFKSMFSHETQENLSGVVVIDDCDPETFPDFLNYLYSGSIQHISEKNVCHLFTASDKYQVDELKEECSEFMKSHLSVKTFCDFITLALHHTEEGLIDSATKFFCANTIEIAKTAKWQIFLKQNSTVGNELFIKSLSR